MSLSPSILRERDLDILERERRLAGELEECLRGFQSSAEDAETLRRVTQALQEPFLLVVAGEFNAGKSAFINALVSERVLQEGVTPTTAHITLLRFGATHSTRLRPDGIEEIAHPATFLRDVAIVDTPGTNAVLRAHLKLLSPLGVMQRLALRYDGEAAQRAALLDEDARTIATVEAQIAAHAEDLHAAFEQRLRAVLSLAQEMRARGDRFFDEMIRLGRVPDLVRREHVRAAFERDVIANTPRAIEEAIAELIDWLVGQGQGLAQSINDDLARRLAAFATGDG